MLDLLLIALLLLIGFYWSNALKARDIALSAVKMYCQKMGVHLLDEYVALNGFWPKRDGLGKVKAWRSYQFEFTSTGDERYNGKLIMLGRTVLSIHLGTYRIED